MTKSQERQLYAAADERGLRLEHRQVKKGQWVWEARDIRNETLAWSGQNHLDLATYLTRESEATEDLSRDAA